MYSYASLGKMAQKQCDSYRNWILVSQIPDSNFKLILKDKKNQTLDRENK